jgi:hypothetical protein
MVVAKGEPTCHRRVLLGLKTCANWITSIFAIAFALFQWGRLERLEHSFKRFKRVSRISKGFIPSFCFLETFQMGLFPPFFLNN